MTMHDENTAIVGINSTRPHIIRVERFGFEPYARRIEVAPGQEIRMTDIVLQPRQR